MAMVLHAPVVLLHVGALRPARAVPYAGLLPLGGVLIGAAVPSLGVALHDWLQLLASLVVFGAAAAVEMGRPRRAELRQAALLLLLSAFVTPALVAVTIRLCDWPADLARGALLAAAGPVALGASVMAGRLGLPMRPVLWGGIAGASTAPLGVPLAVGFGSVEPFDPALSWALAQQTAAIALVPFLAAGLLRALLPRTLAAVAGDCRGMVVLCFTALGCAAGAQADAALGTPYGRSALGAASVVLLFSLAAGLALGVCARASAGALLVGAALRNTSVAWAAAVAAGDLAPRTEAVLAVFLAGNFAVTALVVAVGSRLRRRAEPAIGPATAAPRRAPG